MVDEQRTDSVSETADKPLARIELHFEVRPEYLYVRARGESAEEGDILGVCRSIAAECRHRGARRLLVETELKRQMSVAGYFHVTQQLPKLGFDGVRFAFLDRRNLDFERTRFRENVAFNWGITARVFDNQPAAEAWLTEDSAPTRT
jgi:hypothetical protein